MISSILFQPPESHIESIYDSDGKLIGEIDHSEVNYQDPIYINGELVGYNYCYKMRSYAS